MISISWAGLSVIWVTAVPMLFLIGRPVFADEAYWYARYYPLLPPYKGRYLLSALMLLVFFAAQLSLVPAGLLLAWRLLWPRVRRVLPFGLVTGLFVGAWIDALVLNVPYLGSYPSLLSIAVASRFVPGQAGWRYWGLVFAMNAAIWSIVGLIAAICMRGRQIGRGWNPWSDARLLALAGIRIRGHGYL